MCGRGRGLARSLCRWPLRSRATQAAKKAVEDAQRARNAQGHVQPAFFTLDAKGVWRLKPDVQPTSIGGAAPAAAAAAVAPASPTTEHKKP